jgi:hypothetical protein
MEDIRTPQQKRADENRTRKVVFCLYEKAGFTVDCLGKFKRQPYIDVKCVEAKVDADFYNLGDEL